MKTITSRRHFSDWEAPHVVAFCRRWTIPPPELIAVPGTCRVRLRAPAASYSAVFKAARRIEELWAGWAATIRQDGRLTSDVDAEMRAALDPIARAYWKRRGGERAWRRAVVAADRAQHRPSSSFSSASPRQQPASARHQEFAL